VAIARVMSQAQDNAARVIGARMVALRPQLTYD
jgi:hypothetical protein